MRTRTPPHTSRGAVRACVFTALVLSVVFGGARPAASAPEVFFEPGQVMVDPSQEFELSFRVNDCGDSIASFQLYMSFDHELIELVEATEGSLYAESGLMTWFIEEEEEPGFWHFFDTVFGTGTHLLPPGELLHLRFRALPGAVGYTQAHVDTIRMTDVLRDPLVIAGFEHADIFIAGTGVQGAASSLVLGPATPNPFRDEASISFALPEVGGDSTVEVYDVSGRCVRRLSIPSGTRSGSVEWDGRTDSGAIASSGVYLIRLRVSGQSARTKVVKLH